MALTFDEYAQSPVLDLGLNHSRGKREWIIPWSEVVNFVATIFPITGGAQTAVMPGFPFLFAVGIHIESFGGDKAKITAPVSTDLTYNTVNQYEWAKATVDYETLPYNEDDDNSNDADPVTLLTHRWSIGGEFLTIESAGLEWCDGDDVDESVTAGLLIPTIEHQITWPRVLKPPFESIRERIGTVNDADVSFKTGIILPETLLFLGAELNRDIKTDGSLAWEVCYRFSERRVKAKSVLGTCGSVNEDNHCGWNHFYRSDIRRVGFYRLKTKAISPDPAGDIYELTTFDDLFIEDV